MITAPSCVAPSPAASCCTTTGCCAGWSGYLVEHLVGSGRRRAKVRVGAACTRRCRSGPISRCCIDKCLQLGLVSYVTGVCERRAAGAVISPRLPRSSRLAARNDDAARRAAPAASGSPCRYRGLEPVMRATLPTGRTYPCTRSSRQIAVHAAGSTSAWRMCPPYSAPGSPC